MGAAYLGYQDDNRSHETCSGTFDRYLEKNFVSKVFLCFKIIFRYILDTIHLKGF